MLRTTATSAPSDRDLPTIHCICGNTYSTHLHTVCPECHRWPAASAAEAALLAKRDELAARLRQREPIAVERHADPIDDIWQLTAREVAAGMADADTEMLRQVEAALERIREGSYGTCSSCGEPIAPRRLAAVPWTSLCRYCAELAEEEKAARAAVCGGLTE